ncbi:hypothetical protein INT43_000520 [Umbelopsis isabellina]|uniref:Uncharacterized protein n=1 Tax=Mortierella isabellina TaxID=91625 RepID=A0A8H7UG81_MORIS|nr:hypothetical protein INT43_000520 [Umbelopsis isabellina]
MAPAAYAKPSNSTSDKTNAFGQHAGNSDSNSERSSVYAFPPSWIKTSNNSVPAKLTTYKSTQPSGSAFDKPTDSRQENTDYRDPLLPQHNTRRNTHNTFDSNFPTLATSTADEKQSTSPSVWGNRHHTKEKVIAAHSVEDTTVYNTRHGNEHNVQLERLKALVPKIEPKKRSISSRTKGSLHPARAVSLPAQLPRNSSPMYLKSLSTTSPPPTASSTPTTAKKLAVFRSSQVRQLQHSDARESDRLRAMEISKTEDLLVGHQANSSRNSTASTDDLNDRNMDLADNSQSISNVHHMPMSQHEYDVKYENQNASINLMPEGFGRSRSDLNEFSKQYHEEAVTAEPVYSRAEQIRFLELMRSWTGGSERWQNNCGGISVSAPTTPHQPPSRIDLDDQSSLFGSQDSTPGYNSQLSRSSSSGRPADKQYSYFGHTNVPGSPGDYTYNQARTSLVDAHAVYQQPVYDTSAERHTAYQSSPSFYSRPDYHYGQIVTNDDLSFNKIRNANYPINRHRPGVYPA